MDKFLDKYRIPSARAYWHDYRGGVCFVTICTKNREHFFGEITRNCTDADDCTDAINCTDADDCRDAINRVSTDTDPQMHLSPIGQYTYEQFGNVNTYYPYAEIPLLMVMPNHLHAIVIIDGENATATDTKSTGWITGNYNPMLHKCLGTVIRGLKARITQYANENNVTFAWQSRFYDRIVRDQQELNSIAHYIENNVANWQTDELYETT